MRLRASLGAAVLIFLTALSSPGGAAEVGGEAGFDALSQYVWRGYALSRDSLVIQPYAEVGLKGFGAGLWGNIDTDEAEAIDTDPGSIDFNETDLTLSYEGTYKRLGCGLGFIHYGLEGEDSEEIYLSVSWDGPLSPTLTFYNEITGIQGWYLSLGISHSLPITERASLELGAQAGYLDDERGYDAFHDGRVSISFPVEIKKGLTVVPQLSYSFPLSSEAKENLRAGSLDGEGYHLFGGIGIRLGF